MSFTLHERALRMAADHLWFKRGNWPSSETNLMMEAIEEAIDNHRYQHACMNQRWDAKQARYRFVEKQPKARLRRLPTP